MQLTIQTLNDRLLADPIVGMTIRNPSVAPTPWIRDVMSTAILYFSDLTLLQGSSSLLGSSWSNDM